MGRGHQLRLRYSAQTFNRLPVSFARFAHTAVSKLAGVCAALLSVFGTSSLWRGWGLGVTALCGRKWGLQVLRNRGETFTQTLKQLVCHLCSLDSEWSDDNMACFEGGIQVNQFFWVQMVEVGG